MDDNQMIHPGRSGDYSDAALDAALSAADADMLAAISNGLDLDVGLARILKDLSGSSAAPLDVQAQAPADPGQNQEASPAAHSVIHPRDAEGASPLRVATVIRDINASDTAIEDLYLRARHAADIATRSNYAAQQAAATAEKARVAYRDARTGLLHRRAPLPRQVLLALSTVLLDGVACYFAAQALGGSPDATLAWAVLFLGVLAGGEAALGFYGDRSERTRRTILMFFGLFVTLLGTLRFWFLASTGTGGLMATIIGAYAFTGMTAGFVLLGYRVLRVAETPPTWRARRRARKARQAAWIAHATAELDSTERDRLIDTYLGHVMQRVLRTCPAEHQLAVESGFRKHMLGESRLGELEAWRPSGTPVPGRLTGSWITRWIPAR
jgi:hypothetical protein